MKQIESGTKELYIVEDKDGTPTFTHDFARNVKALLQKENWGLYNMACEGSTSRLEVAQELVEILKIGDSIHINPVSSEYFKEIYFAPRPPSERLVNSKLRMRNINMMRDWRISLQDYLENHYYTHF